MSTKDSIYQFIANNLLPTRLIYWAMVKGFAIATTGAYGKTVAPKLLMFDAMKRVDHESQN